MSDRLHLLTLLRLVRRLGLDPETATFGQVKAALRERGESDASVTQAARKPACHPERDQ